MAMALFGMAVMLGPAIGPTLGGYIVDNYHWSWIFFINLPVGALGLFMVWRFVHEPEDIRAANRAMAEKQRLQDEASLTKRRMDSANALIHGLAGEKDRWTSQSKDFADRISRLVGDSAMSCAFMSYLGPFNKEFREKLLIEYFEAEDDQHDSKQTE